MFEQFTTPVEETTLPKNEVDADEPFKYMLNLLPKILIMEENTKNQIDAIAKEIEVKFENVASTNKDEFNALTEKFNELNSRIDAQEVATKKFNESREPKSFKNSLTKAISEGALDALKNGNARSAKFDIKAGDMTTGANSYTGEVIPADRVAGYKFDPTRSTHVRQLIPTGSTASDVVRFVKESAI